MLKVYIIFLGIVCLSLMACNNQKSGGEVNSEMDKLEQESVPEPLSVWTPLFNGTSIDGWRGYNQEAFPENWSLQDSLLVCSSSDGSTTPSLIFADAEFENFELEVVWKISEAGNSGIFYHGKEGEKYTYIFENAPEYQVLDDLGWPDKLDAVHTVGADYDMYSPDNSIKKVKQAGEWNTSKILFTPEKVEYWLNGQITVSFVPWSEDWNTRRDASKWKGYPDYGKFKKGFIGIQDHGHPVYYKSIRIREL